MIDTKKVAERRQLRFENFGEALDDAERLAAAEAGGSLRQHGNWKLGQALGHVAAWASFPFEGYPEMRRPPWAVRKVFALLKPWFLNRTFPAGISIPHAPGGTYATEEIPTEEALARLGRLGVGDVVLQDHALAAHDVLRRQRLLDRLREQLDSES